MILKGPGLLNDRGHFCIRYQEALAIIAENKSALLALAQALIDHPERTLNAAEIDAVISQTLAREALAAEQARHAVWRRTIESAASAPSN
jgi:hypothetical protein